MVYNIPKTSTAPKMQEGASSFKFPCILGTINTFNYTLGGHASVTGTTNRQTFSTWGVDGLV